MPGLNLDTSHGLHDEDYTHDEEYKRNVTNIESIDILNKGESADLAFFELQKSVGE